MKRNDDGTYVAGVIYELGICHEDEWYPFYVGETTNADTRIATHRSSAKAGKQLLVYNYMRQLLACDAQTEMKLVDSYGTEGPADLEDEHIMKLLFEDRSLMNMKKGSNVWMKNMVETKGKMKVAGFTSLRKYKEWDAEEARIKNDARLEKLKYEAHCKQRKPLSLIDKIKSMQSFQDDARTKEIALQAAMDKSADILKSIKR